MATKSFGVHMSEDMVRPVTERAWGSYLLWILAAALLGFAIAEVFAGVLHLLRAIYLIPYVGLVGLLFYAFLRWSNTSLLDLLRHKWPWGLVVAVPLGAFTVNNILSQPASPRSQGLSLVFELLWVGVVYGLVDAILLSVLPVMATWKAFGALGWTLHWWGKILVSLVAVLLCLGVTVAYHLGYPECRVAGGLSGPMLGNAAMSLGYVLSGNPVASLFSHMAMHIAGVLQGPASVLQLPPHY